MRRLIEQARDSIGARYALSRRVRDGIALAAIFLLVPVVGLTALVAPPWAVARVAAPLWRTVWAPVGSTLGAHHSAPLLEASGPVFVRDASATAGGATLIRVEKTVAAKPRRRPAPASLAMGDGRALVLASDLTALEPVRAQTSPPAPSDGSRHAVPAEREPPAESQALAAPANARTPELPADDGTDAPAGPADDSGGGEPTPPGGTGDTGVAAVVGEVASGVCSVLGAAGCDRGNGGGNKGNGGNNADGNNGNGKGNDGENGNGDGNGVGNFVGDVVAGVEGAVAGVTAGGNGNGNGNGGSNDGGLLPTLPALLPGQVTPRNGERRRRRDPSLQ
jgi:hypothetical protein